MRRAPGTYLDCPMGLVAGDVVVVGAGQDNGAVGRVCEPLQEGCRLHDGDCCASKLVRGKY